MKKISKVVIPVAGLGTRMLPATKAIPKEMLPVLNKPIIQYIVEEAVHAGFEEVILVTHSSKYSIENHFDKSFELEATLEKRVKRSLLKEIRAISKLKISMQSIRQGEARGLGHAILCAKKLIGKEPFAVILPDMLISKENGNAGDSLKKMRLNYEEKETSSILLGKAKKADIPKYGIVQIEKHLKVPWLGSIKKIVEKPSIEKAPSNLYAVGRYIFKNDFFKYLTKQKPDKRNEIQLTDALARRVSHTPFYAHLFEGTRYDCGSKLGFLKANISLAMERPLIRDELVGWMKTLVD